MADKEPCFWCGKESVMTLTLAGVKRRACIDCGQKVAGELAKAGSDIGISAGGELVSYVPSKQLIAEVKGKAKAGRLICAHCSRRIEAKLAGFHVYIPHDMQGRHPYVLCPSCESKVTAGDKEILEAVEEKIESGKYKLAEETDDYELYGEPISNGTLTKEARGAGRGTVDGEPKDWIVVIKLETGEATTATTENGCIKLFTRDEAAAYIANFEIKKNPSIRLKFAFLPLKATEVKIAGVEAIPRAAYIQEKHDSFQFEEMRKRPKGILKETLALMGSRGLMVDIDHPESALDAVAALLRLMERPVIQGTEANRRMIIQLLSEAHPIAWSRHMRRMAFDAIEQLREPLAVEQDTLMLNPMVFLYSEPQWHWVTAKNGKFPFSPHGRKPFLDEVAIEAGEFDVAEIFSQDGGVNCFRIALTAGEDLKWATAAYMSSWLFGSVPEDVHDQRTLKCLRFAASPYLMLKRYQPQRAALRRAKHLELTVPKQGINVIILRRAQYISNYPRHGEGEPVEWSCQWWVSGFWRRQWHPSTKGHKLTYIASYIKGPPDKPLKDAIRLIVR